MNIEAQPRTQILQVQEVGGHKLLVGKPDKKTEHMASLVSRQLDNRSGYNVLTGKVLQAFGVAENSARVVVEKPLRSVSKHLLNQLKELLEVRGALLLSKVSAVYEEEFGYKIEWRKLGFSCLEDLFTSDIEAAALFSLTPELLGWVVQFKEEGCDNYSSFRRNILVPKPVQVNFKQLKYNSRFDKQCFREKLSFKLCHPIQESLRSLLLARPQGVPLSALPFISSQ